MDISFKEEWKQCTKKEKLLYLITILIAIISGLAGIFCALQFSFSVSNHNPDFIYLLLCLVAAGVMYSTKLFPCGHNKNE